MVKNQKHVRAVIIYKQKRKGKYEKLWRDEKLENLSNEGGETAETDYKAVYYSDC